MARYLLLSLAVNFILFFVYSYTVGKALQTVFAGKIETVEPLTLRIETKFLQWKGENTPPAAGTGENPTVGVKTQQQYAKKSLIETLLPAVQKEFKRTFQKLVSRAEAKLVKGKGITFSLNRRIVYVPPVKPLEVGYPPAPVEVKITVLPDGRVIDATLVKRSGNPKVDRAVLNFVRNLRFAPINRPLVQEIYILFHFKY